MSQYVNLDMTYTTYSRLCDAVMEAATHAEDFDEIQEKVHLLDFLEDEYERDLSKQHDDIKTWKLHEELFRNKEFYHHQYFHSVENVFEDNIERGLLEWKISEQDKFHLICELIDVFKKEDQI